MKLARFKGEKRKAILLLFFIFCTRLNAQPKQTADEKIKGQTPIGYVSTRERLQGAIRDPEAYYGYRSLFLGQLTEGSTFYSLPHQFWPVKNYFKIWGKASEFVAVNEDEEEDRQNKSSLERPQSAGLWVESQKIDGLFRIQSPGKLSQMSDCALEASQAALALF